MTGVPGDEHEPGPGPASGTADERAREGVEHLQAAAQEVIAAARAMLDVAEELVADPAAAASVLSGFLSLARMARQGADSAGGRAGDGDRRRPPDEGDPGIQHIPVV